MKTNLYFLHGWGMHSAVWQPICAALGDAFNIRLIDLPGYGNKQQIPINEYSLESISEQIISEIDQPGVFIGWSLGGLVAQYIALHRPALCQALVGVATSPCFSADEDWPAIEPSVLDNFAKMLQRNPNKTIERFIAIQSLGSERPKQDIKSLLELLAQTPNANLAALNGGLAILKQADLRTQIKQIQCPTLRIYGRLDSLVPAKAIPLITQYQPNSQNQLINKAAHAPFISHQSEFLAALYDFIKKL